MNHSDPIAFEQLINSSINKPARYMGHELGIKDKDWGKARIRWALTYPELYEVGISNSGHIILYSILNQMPGQMCDRAYLPAPDMSKRLKELSLPLFGIESRKSLFLFDILGFSLSYELGATNILEMLNLSDIPLYSSNRGNLELDHPNSPPLIFAGGPTATSNPEPFADFFDFFALGDGEELLPEIGLVVAESKQRKLTRIELLQDLAEIPGVYVPSLYKVGQNKISIEPTNPKTQKRVLRRVANPMPFYGMGLVPNIETVHDRLTIEIRRGCTRGCRFCQPGMLTRPARDVDPKEVINAVKIGMQQTGYTDFSLLSLSCSDYLALPAVGVELRNRLDEHNVSLQLPSQRIDRFDNDIAHILGGTRKSGLTFAPEAGSQRLRDIVNKGLTDEDLLNGVRTAMENQYRKIKLYFMIGLPGETDEDVLGIALTCQMLQKQCQDLGRLKLNITISNFTPKPHTPFQWHSVSTQEFERRQKLLKEAFKPLKGVKVNFTDIRLSAIEDFIGRGGRELSSVIESAWRKGAVMDAWFESIDITYQAWTEAITEKGLQGKYRSLEMGNWNAVSALEAKDLNEFCSQPLPWDHIDSGVSKKWLASDLQKALQRKVVDDCSFGGCSHCGVCGDALGHNKIVKAPTIPAHKTKQFHNQERACRVRLKFSKTNPIHFLSHLDLIRLFERAIRRSQLPISYTGGFHPLPRIQVAIALPLGVEAYGEWMDIEFFKQIDAASMRQKLQKELPKGIFIFSATNIPSDAAKLNQLLEGSIWSFALRKPAGEEPKLGDWQKAINSLLKANELIWHDKSKKGKERSRNCLPLLNSISIKKNNLKNFDLTNNRKVELEINTLFDQMGRSVKPLQIKHWLESYFDSSLEIQAVRRDEIKLNQC